MPRVTTRMIVRAALALLFIAAGILHFVATPSFMAIVPPSLPWHRELVLISGVFEIVGGVGLMLPPFRRYAGYGLLLLLIAVFPANIYMAIAHVPATGVLGNRVLQWIRLPFQFVLMSFTLWCSKK